MDDNSSSPIWVASKNGGRIGGCIGCAGGFLLPWGVMALAFIFYPNDPQIGALVPFLPLVLAPVGFSVLGVAGLIVGALIGILSRKPRPDEEDSPPIAAP